MDGWSVVDAVAEIAYDVAPAPKRLDHPILLRGRDTAEEVHGFDSGRERGVAHLLDLASGEHAGDRETQLRAEVLGHELMVARHHLDLDAAFGQGSNGFGRAGL